MFVLLVIKSLTLRAHIRVISRRQCAIHVYQSAERGLLPGDRLRQSKRLDFYCLLPRIKIPRVKHCVTSNKIQIEHDFSSVFLRQARRRYLLYWVRRLLPVKPKWKPIVPFAIDDFCIGRECISIIRGRRLPSNTDTLILCYIMEENKIQY